MTDDPLRTEFDALILRAGIPVPDDRRELLFNGFKELRAELPRLRQAARTAADEPAPVYSLDSIVRTIAPGVAPRVAP